MKVFHYKANITRADALDYIFPILGKSLPDELLIQKDISFNIDTESKTVSFEDQSYSFDGNLVWLLYNTETNEINLLSAEKTQYMIIYPKNTSRLLANIYYDRSEDKLYIIQQNKLVYPYVFNVTCNVSTTENDQYYEFSVTCDRWDMLLTSVSNSFSYNIAVPNIQQFTTYSDIRLFLTGLFPILDSNHIYLYRSGNILLHDTTTLQFKLIQFGQDFTDEFADKFIVYDNSNQSVSFEINDDGYIEINVDQIYDLWIVPKTLERVLLSNTYILVTNPIYIKLIHIE